MNKIKSFTSRWSLKDDEGPSDPILRRKEQVRKAQQNYRQRKEGYIKSLEREVIHLRSSRSELQGETKKLNSEVGWLRAILAQYEIAVPPMPEVSPLTAQDQEQSLIPVSPTATVCVARDHKDKKRVIVLEDSEGTSTSGSFPTSGSTPDPAGASIHGDVVAGMNFILSLEGPCLEHVRSSVGVQSTEPDQGHVHGHALTLTASVFRLYDDSSIPPAEDQLLSVSRQTLDRLLQLSSQLSTGDELTPIQIWSFLCQSGWLGNARPQQVSAVAEELLEYIQCYGYGAVIPREVVTRVISNAGNG
ncbi:hypothetical protein BJX70DRAFT_361361 [Aspergillus crustosus]